MNYSDYVSDHLDEMLEALKALIQIPSVLMAFNPSDEKAPFGEPIVRALDTMLEKGKDDGFITKDVNGYAGHIEWGEGDEILGILTHLDVVPAETGKWTRPPFQPAIVDGKIYGRGSMDDKGPTIAAYFAMKFLRDLGVTPSKRVRLIMGTDEETAWRGIERYLNEETMPTAGFSPDAEFPVIHGEKGIFSFDLTGPYKEGPLKKFEAGERYNVVPGEARAVLDIDLEEAFNLYIEANSLAGRVEGNTYVLEGKSAHAMSPEKGINAAYHLATFLAKHIDTPYVSLIADLLAFDHLGKRLGIALYDEALKNLSMNAAVFRYDQSGAKIGINCRFPNGFEETKAKEAVQASAGPYGYTYEHRTTVPQHFIPEDDPLVDTLMACYKEVTGDKSSKPFTIGGGTYARALDKGVAFGLVMPGREDVAHQVDEHIFIDDLVQATVIYMKAI
ncbi:MAG: dipeptidase PepV, partial [Candidatus Izemoplasmataceae bacterium]